MAQSRGLIREIFKNFINTLIPRKYWGVIVGRDHLGTTYYEIPLDKPGGSLKRRSRWFVPRDTTNFQQDIPPQWLAWLQHKRKLPPTEEEILISLMTSETARKEAAKKDEEARRGQPSCDEELKAFKKPSFPKYDEYQNFPETKNK